MVLRTCIAGGVNEALENSCTYPDASVPPHLTRLNISRHLASEGGRDRGLLLDSIVHMFRMASRSSRKQLLKISSQPLSELVGKYAASVGNVGNYSSLASAEQRLAGQVAVITGGASGIGARTARLFTEHGARVVIADIQASLGEKVAKELGPQAEFVHCDVRKEEDIIKAWDKAYSLEKKLDIVYNNAGILGASGPISELPIAEFDATMAVNLRGMVLGVKHAARLMIPAGKGSIICTTSVAGMLGGYYAFGYSTSKGAAIHMVKCAAAELRPFGIRVNSISPDGIATPLALSAMMVTQSGQSEGSFTAIPTVEMLEEGLKQRSLIHGRGPTTLDIANTALYLGSDMGGFVTGQNLAVCGGQSNLSTGVTV